MDRRAFIGSLALGTLAAPHVARAQSARKVHRIGILSSTSATSDMVGPQPRSPSVNALLGRLRELGYVYGEHFVTEPRGGEGKPERFPDLATELVRLQVDVIVAAGPMLPALQQATSTIPIVTTGAGDPVASGTVQSLARPGGNITGLSLQLLETTGKRLELREHAVEVDLSLEIREANEIEGAFKTATGGRAGALLVVPGGLLDPHARRIAELAARSRLPAMYAFRFYVEAGGLISYGVDQIENNRRAAVFVDKILKGAKPADLPIEQPTKFELVINLKAAKSLGLTIPQPLLSRADEVIQ